MQRLGTNLKGTTRELNQIESNIQITWYFNPSAAPHMGGIWERIIRTVKNVMFSNTVLTEVYLMAIIIEIKTIVNNRPLTYVSNNPDDLELLTPNYLLQDRCNTGAIIEENDADISSCRRWKQVVVISNQFFSLNN